MYFHTWIVSAVWNQCLILTVVFGVSLKWQIIFLSVCTQRDCLSVHLMLAWFFQLWQHHSVRGHVTQSWSWPHQMPARRKLWLNYVAVGVRVKCGYWDKETPACARQYRAHFTTNTSSCEDWCPVIKLIFNWQISEFICFCSGFTAEEILVRCCSVL